MTDERNAREEEFFDMDGAEQLSRRGFDRFLTLGGLAAAVGAAGTLTDGCSKTYPTIVVAHAGDIPVGGWKIFSYPADVNPCILLRPDQNTYLAYSRICTHTSCPVFYGRRRIGSSASAMAAFIRLLMGRCWRAHRRGPCLKSLSSGAATILWLLVW
jgi:Rieske Fe-S protein